MELVLQSQIFKFYSDFIGRKSREILFDKIGKEEIMDFLDEFNDKPILKVNYYNALNAFYKFTYDTQRTSDVMKDVPRPLPPVIEPPKYIEESRSWGINEEKFKKLIEDNRIWFGSKGNSMPRLKRFLSEVSNGIVPKTIWNRDEVGDNSEGKKEIKRLFNSTDNIFTTPKPERLLQRIISISTNEGDWVLDAFLGSGTTCAVAQKLNRKWIGLENGDQMNSICIPRLEKVIQGLDNGGITKDIKWNGGGGFNYYEIES